MLFVDLNDFWHTSGPFCFQHIICQLYFHHVMSRLSYHSRLKALNLENLELTRLRADLLLAYKILFGLLRVNSDIFFTPRNQSQLRGHAYMLHKPRCFSSNCRIFSAFELLVCGTACPPTPRTSPD